MLTITGYIQFSPPPTFGLPIFRDSETEKLYIQFAEPGGDVLTATFEEDEDAVCELSCPDMEHNRNVLTYVFLDGVDIHVGTSDSLAPTLRSFQAENPKEAAVNLQIAEIVGTAAERERARIHLLEESKPDAATSGKSTLVMSMAYEDVWRALYESCKDGAAQQVLTSYRRRVSREFDFADPNLLPHDLRTKIEPHLRRSLKDICQSILLNVSEVAAMIGEDIRDSDSRWVPDDLAMERRIRRILDSVWRLTRQEQRISRLMREVLRDSKEGTYALHRFRPKAKFEQVARERILKRLASRGQGESLQTSLAILAQELYSVAYPQQRGRFLLYLAKELGDYPDIAKVIRRAAVTSQGYEVQHVQSKILEHLIAVDPE